ncbi:MAG: SpoIIE family protein phosphatase [Planctomycetia bacterium]|nr:SpoIIE family protein phosphatase [Planctomycetia bacterium]
MPSRISLHESGDSSYPSVEAGFLQELFCIGSLPPMLRHFQKMTGWNLTYHQVDSALSHGFSSENLTVSIGNVPQEAELPSPLPPSLVRELVEEEDLWIPIEIEACHVPDHVLSERLKGRNGAYMVGFLHLEKEAPKEKQEREVLSFEQARRWAVALGDFLSEMQTLRMQVWVNESEKANFSKLMNRPVSISQPVFAPSFRRLLECVLDNLGMDAVGIYLLDTAGTALKLRAGVGLPLDRLSVRPRVLEEAMPDLISLQTGEIRVIDEKTRQEGLVPPEDFLSAICLPLVTNRSLMGTVWFFSNHDSVVDEFTSRLAEMAADHISGELERAAFFNRYAKSLEYRREVKQAVEIQKNQLPLKAAWLEKIGLFGWVRPTRYVTRGNATPQGFFDEEVLSGDFYDWFSLPHGKWLIALGNVGCPGLAGAMMTASVKSALRSHACYEQTASSLLRKVHQTLWQQSAAEGKISLFCGLVDAQKERLAVSYAMAGTIRGISLQADSTTLVRKDTTVEYTPFLGGCAEFHCFEDILYLGKEESLVLYHDGFVDEKARNVDAQRLDRELARRLADKRRGTSRLLGSIVKNYFTREVAPPDGVGQSVLVLRNFPE